MRVGYTLTEYFYFKNKERKGLIYVSICCVIASFIPLTFPFFQSSQKIDFSEFKQEIAAFYADEEKDELALNENIPLKISHFQFNPNTASKDDFQKLGLSPRTSQSILNYRNKGGKFFKKEDFKKIYTLKSEDYERLKNYISIPDNHPIAQVRQKKSYEYDHVDKVIAQEFSFDPNTVSYEDLIRLGISSRAAKGLIKYRNAGAVFRKKTDFKKVYNIEEADYNRLENYIDLPEKFVSPIPERTQPIYKKKEWTPVYVDINNATVDEWQKLRGIGPGYANWIVKHRERLGGFVTIEQVSEVYNFPDSTYQSIKEFLTNESPNLTKISINRLTAEEIKNHPYIQWKQANRIVAFRKQHGAFSDMDAI
ncbi:MAG: competence ComEA-like helix-hairpin-helix protein, partial [Saprospiraceae bacterium]